MVSSGPLRAQPRLASSSWQSVEADHNAHASLASADDENEPVPVPVREGEGEDEDEKTTPPVEIKERKKTRATVDALKSVLP